MQKYTEKKIILFRNLPLALLILALLGRAITAHAQLENVWAFGRNAGLNFAGGNPTAIVTEMNSREGSASVCDAAGQLLFYTEGTFIWDRNGNVMPNGSDLTPIPFFWAAVGFGQVLTSPTSSTSQGVLIVPDPGSPQQYYVFSLTSQETESDAGRLYYSKVDMSLNDGQGDIIPGQKGILLDTALFEKMGAVAGDRCNYWLMACSQELVFKAYEITDAGVTTTPVLSPVAIGLTGNLFLFGNLVFSPDRHKLAITQASGSGLGMNGASLYDFNPGTGTVSNPINLLPSISAGYGICFSPDNSRLYLNETTGDSLYQFDLTVPTSTAILSSKTGIVSYSLFSQIKAGPDGKLYLLGTGSSPATSLSVINNPNGAGASCDYVADVVALLPGSSGYIGLPNTVPPLHRDTIVTVQFDTAGCFVVNPTLSAGNADGFNYEWSTGANTAQTAVTSGGTYWVRYNTPPCNYRIDTIHLALPYGIMPAVSTQEACKETANGTAWAATFAGDTVHYFYTWVNGAGDTLSVTDTLNHVPAGAYSLLIHKAHCDTSINFIIPEVDYRVSFSASDTLICMGESVQFQNSSDAHFTHFQWYFGDGDSALLQQPPDHQYLHAGIYEVLLSGTGAICKDSAYTTITVDSLFTLDFEPDQPAICTGDHINFQLSESDSTLTQLHWSFGDGSELHSTYEPMIQHAYDTAGNFPVTLTTHFRACPDNFYTDTIQVYVLPLVDLGGDSSLCLDGHAVVLHNLAAAPNDTHHYLWSTGDTTAGLRVLQPGRYSLRITTEPLGCNVTDVIEVTKGCYIDIPNAFTPNSDGYNDYFFPRSLLSQDLSSFKMQVFNRWGQVVFETATTDGRGWDGRFNDKDQPLGVYIYLVDVAYTNDRQERYKGNVTLIR